MVRAKFHVTNVEAGEEGATIYMSPVYTGSPENEQFYRYTPSSQIILTTVNLEAAAQFAVNQQYYVDFTRLNLKPKHLD